MEASGHQKKGRPKLGWKVVLQKYKKETIQVVQREEAQDQMTGKWKCDTMTPKDQNWGEEMSYKDMKKKLV